MFDLTKQIGLEKSWQKKYRLAQILLYLLFIAGLFYLGYAILFPSKNIFYSFINKSEQSDLMANFQIQNQPVKNNDQIGAGENFSFDSFTDENHSKAKIVLTLNSGSLDKGSGTLELSKTYQAFALPLSQKLASFPEGSLVQNSGKYFIVSEGKLRQFQTAAIVKVLGYNPEAFLEATDAELTTLPSGPAITDAKSYPESTLFVINQNYYQLKGGTLYKFISPRAFASRFSPDQAIPKDSDFLNNYSLSPEPIGFADGSLLSFNSTGNGTVFIVLNGKVLPIPDPFVFDSFGFSWSDVVPATEDEMGIYTRDKFFSVNQPHPNGTVFQKTETGKYYLVRQGTREEIRGNSILKTLLKRTPIAASQRGMDFKESCNFYRASIFSKKYACVISNENLNSLPGNDYKITIHSQNPVKINDVEVIFSENVNFRNLLMSLTKIRNRLYSHYGYVPVQ